MTVLNDYLAEAHRLRQAGQPFVLATVVRAERPTSAKAGAKAIVTADGELSGWIGGSCARPAVVREARRALQDGQPRLLRLVPPENLGRAAQAGVIELALTCVSGGTLEIYLEPHLAQPHLVAISHLPIAEALVTLGKGLGFAVTVVGLEAEQGRYPLADRVLDRLDFARIPLTSQTYIVVASHGNYDEEALEWALATEAPYVALVASRKRAESLREYLRSTGLSEAQVARLHCPAGLDFGAVTPEEIALSILAEIVHLRRTAPAQAPPEVAEAAPAPAEAVDPVCGMLVEIDGARHTAEYKGQVYYFCCSGCQRSFEAEPERYVG
jgi:xanthine dehydrogenase accessory factor